MQFSSSSASSTVQTLSTQSTVRLGHTLLLLIAQYSLLGQAIPSWTDSTDCIECYRPNCTMSTEKLWHVKLFYNRKQGITPEEFNRYWAYEHGPRVQDFHLRLGVVRYNQVCIGL